MLLLTRGVMHVIFSLFCVFIDGGEVIYFPSSVSLLLVETSYIVCKTMELGHLSEHAAAYWGCDASFLFLVCVLIVGGHQLSVCETMELGELPERADACCQCDAASQAIWTGNLLKLLR
jgi:hypothetical protein